MFKWFNDFILFFRKKSSYNIHAKKALQEETDPRELDAIRAEKVKYAILEAVYSKKIFCL